jgi:type III restriction enzyme
MEGKKTLDSLKEFNPLFIMRYSATHKTQHNKIHRLDALDAYNQKLVKKIAVRGIAVKGLPGTTAYLYLESITVTRQSPTALLEIEVKQNSGIKCIIRRVGKGDNLHVLSGELDQYKGFVISEINAVTDTLSFTNGVDISAGEAVGDINEMTLRRIQIREAIKAHFEKEQALFHQGIKVLTLFFIDEVAKYRIYDGSEAVNGEYADIFEEEYREYLKQPDLPLDPAYKNYLEKSGVHSTHNGYFSIDKKSKRMIDPVTGKRSTEADDVDAYDLILKDKERLLSFDEPTRFIFSHSALREGWDNPNVFVICTLKHSNNSISRRQEVGRGLRIAVNQDGDRQDDPATVHQTNVLTVVASESYKNFVTELQKNITESISERPRIADVKFFTNKILKTKDGNIVITEQLAKHLHHYLIKNDYIDENDSISQDYNEAVKAGELAELPSDLTPYKDEVFRLIASVYSDVTAYEIEDDRAAKTNPLNDNFNKKEFKELWSRINKKAVYSVSFDTNELIQKCSNHLSYNLKVAPLQYRIERGEQVDKISYEELTTGKGFEVKDISTQFEKKSIRSLVKYDLIGKIAEETKLTRKTIAAILKSVPQVIFDQFKTNPENFISESVRLINEQKATMIIEHLKYDSLNESYGIDIFTDAQVKQDFSKAGKPLLHHIYDYVITDSKIERNFVDELDVSTEVVVYAKLPKGFFIPTPVGNYNPDWAITFKEGVFKHIYFVAETKGSMSSLELREIEKTKIKCARKFFDEVNKKIEKDNVTYDVVNSYSKLMDVVG